MPNSNIMVIGAGISGIEAGLTLAEQGYKVILVERTSSVGGRMAQLDKTFPTLDCSICILAPKMVESSRHPNIELLMYSEVHEVSGEVGNFNVKVLKKAKYAGYFNMQTTGKNLIIDLKFNFGELINVISSRA